MDANAAFSDSSSKAKAQRRLFIKQSHRSHDEGLGRKVGFRVRFLGFQAWGLGFMLRAWGLEFRGEGPKADIRNRVTMSAALGHSPQPRAPRLKP